MRATIFVFCLTLYCAPTLEDNVFTRIYHQGAQLSEDFRGWIKNTKLLVFANLGKAFLDSGDPNQGNRRQFSSIDLKTLHFDPKRDWGFRVGNWYYIRKSSVAPGKPVERNDGKIGEESEEGFEDLSGQNGGEKEVGPASSRSPLEPDELSIPAKSPNNADRKGYEDTVEAPHSVEVLKPAV